MVKKITKLQEAAIPYIKADLKVIIKDISLTYQVKYDYSYEQGLEHDTSCTNEGICRCSTIEDARVTEYNTEKIARYIMSGSIEDRIYANGGGHDEFLMYVYGLERIINKNINNTDAFEINICNGYYGEEIRSITLNSDVALEIQTLWDKYINLATITEKVHFLLTLEYGYILEDLKDAKFYLDTVNIRDIVFPNDRYVKKLLKTNKYDNYSLIQGICRKHGNKYEVIDGYNRIAAKANKPINNNQIDIIVAETNNG